MFTGAVMRRLCTRCSRFMGIDYAGVVWRGAGRGVRAPYRQRIEDKHPALKDKMKGSVEAVRREVRYFPPIHVRRAGVMEGLRRIIPRFAPEVARYSVRCGGEKLRVRVIVRAGLDYGSTEDAGVNLSRGTTQAGILAAPFTT